MLEMYLLLTKRGKISVHIWQDANPILFYHSQAFDKFRQSILLPFASLLVFLLFLSLFFSSFLSFFIFFLPFLTHMCPKNVPMSLSHMPCIPPGDNILHMPTICWCLQINIPYSSSCLNSKSICLNIYSTSPLGYLLSSKHNMFKIIFDFSQMCFLSWNPYPMNATATHSSRGRSQPHFTHSSFQKVSNAMDSTSSLHPLIPLTLHFGTTWLKQTEILLTS